MAALAQSKQDQLANCIADAVKSKMDPDIKALVAQNAVLTVTLNSVAARLAALEACLPAGAGAGGGAGVQGKRQTRTAAGTAGGAKKPAAKPGDKKGAASVTNALLFFRRAMAENIKGIRDEYATAENLEAADASPAVAKVDKENEPAYYSAVGAFLWAGLSDASKNAIRAQFADWKNEQARDDADPPLEEE